MEISECGLMHKVRNKNYYIRKVERAVPSAFNSYIVLRSVLGTARST